MPMQEDRKPNYLNYLYKNRPKWTQVKVVLTTIISWLKNIFSSKEQRSYIVGGLIMGFVIAFLFLPETKSELFWIIIGVVATIIAEYLLRSWEKFREQTSMGKLLGPIYSLNAKCTIFITEYWRNIGKDNIYLHDKRTKVRGTSRLMGSGDSTALPYIFGLLMKAGKSSSEISTIKSYIDYKTEWDSNFICIGGLTNKVTEKLITNYKDRLPYYFSKGGNSIIKNYGSKEKYLRGNSEHDYGMIIKIKGLNNPNKVLFVVAGIQDLGTAGAAYYLFNNIEKLATKYGNDDFGLIIGVKREIGEKSTFEVNFDEISKSLQWQRR